MTTERFALPADYTPARDGTRFFYFTDVPLFPCFTLGSTWNGFDNVAISPEVRDVIAATMEDDEGRAELMAIQPDEHGRISLAMGYAAELEPDTEETLSLIYRTYLAAQGLPEVGAEDLIHCNLTEAQGFWVSAFIVRWEVMRAVEGLAEAGDPAMTTRPHRVYFIDKDDSENCSATFVESPTLAGLLPALQKADFFQSDAHHDDGYEDEMDPWPNDIFLDLLRQGHSGLDDPSTVWVLIKGEA